MFCAKCGTKISESDQYCPKCGKENLNYVEYDVKPLIIDNGIKIQQSKENSDINGQKGVLHKKIVFPAIIGGFTIIIGVAILLLAKGAIEGRSTNSRISIKPYSTNGYIDTNDIIHFVHSGDSISFNGKAKSGKSTPDQSKHLVLYDDKSLALFNETEAKPIPISDNVNELCKVTDFGCFYIVGDKEQLFYFDFKKAKAIDTGIKESTSTLYSESGNAVISLGKNGEIRSFQRNRDSSQILCNASTETELCSATDDGSNAIWAIKDGNVYSIYTLINGTPERIGRITNAEKYSSIYGLYFNDDQSFYVYSSGSAQMIVGHNNQVTELTLPGVKDYGAVCCKIKLQKVAIKNPESCSEKST